MPSKTLTSDDLERISEGHHAAAEMSFSLRAEAYTDELWRGVDRQAIFARSWQWICHVERLRAAGSYVAAEVAGMPIVILRGSDGRLRAFYNVCKHRAHELLSGSGVTKNIVCPYHAWTFGLDGQLKAARRADTLPGFRLEDHCLDPIQVEEFGGFVYANLDPDALPLAEQAPDLAEQIAHWAPDVESLTLAKRLEYRIKSNWKNVIDNFLECYHCHIAHKEFVELVDMDTYIVKTYGIWSSHFAEAGKSANAAYDVSEATVRDHAVWWLWPNTCLLRYPGRGNFMVLQVLPDGAGGCTEIWDFYLESTELSEAEVESMRYIDEVLQVQDIAIVESVQRGMATPAFDQGRIVSNPSDAGLSEHGVHHFHGLVLQAYRDLVLHTHPAHAR
jgi:phenylpropionate dioxygenase-like ring-hydroxylating dioxygenase large terminal subunit